MDIRLTIFCLGLLLWLTASAWAEPTKGKMVLLREMPLTLTTPDGDKVRRGSSVLQVVCLDGYKYVLLGHSPLSGINQIFRWDEQRQQTVPVRCSQSQPSGLHQDE